MEKTRIIFPCHWDKSVINQIANMQSDNESLEMKEIYGTLANSPIPHGRIPSTVPDISKQKAVDFRQYVRSKGFNFIYLLNAPFSFNSKATKKKVESYLDWIVNDFQCDAVTVSSLELMHFIRKIYPDLKIYISTIAGVLTVKDFEKYLEINPSRLVVHHDVNRDFDNLKKIVQRGNKENVQIELTLTESCLRNCPNRKAHYEHISKTSQNLTDNRETVFHTVCNARKLIYPFELLKANIIRPEDVSYYENIGINHFKITGRSKPTIWILLVAQAYITRKHSGNLIRLLGIDPSLKAEDWIYLNNNSLNNFIDEFPKSGNQEEENTYCNKWIIQLYNQGNFFIADKTVYAIDKKGYLKLKSPGFIVSKILKKELKDD